MRPSTWPRLRSAATCCCPRGPRLYSWRGDNGKPSDMDQRDDSGAPPRSRPRMTNRLEHTQNFPKRTSPKVKIAQAQRNWRKKLAEGRLSPAERRKMIAAIEEDVEGTAAGFLEDIAGANLQKLTGPDTGADAGQKSDGSPWPLLTRRHPTADSYTALEPTKGFGADESGEATVPQKWPLLKRREPSSGYMMSADMPDLSTAMVADTQEALRKNTSPVTDKSHLMLRISGLSTNVKSSDFYRIAENDLSKWNQSIRKVQQVRDKTTLEPTGTYNLTFSTSMAAAGYAARFKRLHALAQAKARSKTGLWQSELPADLQPPLSSSSYSIHDTVASLEAELAQFTIATGAQQTVLVKPKRVASGPATAKMSSMVARDGHGERPAVVLLDVAPQATLERVREAVQRHGQRTRGSWAMARPHAVGFALHQQLERLNTTIAHATKTAFSTEEEEEQVDYNDDASAASVSEDQKQEAEEQRRAALRSREGPQRLAAHLEGAALRRFLVSFRDMAEAQRFHRLWNARWLGGHVSPPPPGRPQHFVRTQVIEW